MNYIHEIDYKVKKSAIHSLGAEGNIFNAVVEISNGDNVKYEVHPSGKYLTAVRTLNPIFRYPFSYGFIPQTLEQDGDGLDVIIITPEPLAHLAVVEIRVLGYIPTVDMGENDMKIIAVPAYSTLKKVSLDKVLAFLKNYKYPNNAGTLVGEFFADISKAERLIEEAHEAYIKVNTVVEKKESELFASQKIKAEPIVEPTVLTVKPVEETPSANSNIDIPQDIDVKDTVKQEQPVDMQESEIKPAVEEEKTDSSVPFLEEVPAENTEKETQDDGWLS